MTIDPIEISSADGARPDRRSTMPSSQALHSGPTGPGAFACIVCGGHRSTPVVERCRDRYLGSTEVVDYHRCERCGLVQQHPLPQDVGRFYEAYPVHQRKSRLYSLARRALMSGVYLDPATWGAGARLLDYGCGDGWYLEWCRERGVQAVGFEPDAGHAARLAGSLGVPVYSDVGRLAADHAGAFDVITLHFVLEHLTDILAVLAPIRGLLRPGGFIRYVVPNIDSWEFRLFRRRWHSLDPPRHISFPDARHARRLASALSLEYAGEESAPFPNGFGGSIPTLLTGRFRSLLFLATLPLSIPVTRLFPSGNRAYRLSLPA